LIDPEGNPFISKGVCHITFRGDAIQRTGRSPYQAAVTAKYGEAEHWRYATAARLLDWGFNSLGAWSDSELRYVVKEGRRLVDSPILDLGAGFVRHQQPGAEAWLHGLFPDVFDAGFETYCHTRARERCAEHRTDPSILGWFTDNELRWGPDWRGNDELLTLFLNLPTGAAGRKLPFNCSGNVIPRSKTSIKPGRPRSTVGRIWRVQNASLLHTFARRFMPRTKARNDNSTTPTRAGPRS
jgi:hypothetical protein